MARYGEIMENFCYKPLGIKKIMGLWDYGRVSVCPA